MNYHKNGEPVVGSIGSYQNILSGLRDLMRGKPKSFEVHHFGMKLKEAGLKAGLTRETIESDWQEAHTLLKVKNNKAV